MSLFWVADNHFGHKNIIKYCNRPFDNVKDMDETMVKKWNQVVKPSDTIRVVGDFAFTCSMEYALSIIKRLNGTKHLIVGNHDELALGMNDIRPGTWKTIKDLEEVCIQGQWITNCHYALRTWNRSYKGSWATFGHTHGTLPPYGKSKDVGVDCHDFIPIHFDQLKTFMDNQPNVHAIPKNQEWDKSDGNK